MLKPSDIESVLFDQVELGYSPNEVDVFLEQITQDYRELFRSNIEYKDKLEILTESLDYYRSSERNLQSSIAVAEQSAKNTRDEAVVKAKNIEKEAEVYATEIVRKTKNELYFMEQRVDELRARYDLMRNKFKALLVTELDLIEKTDTFFNNDEDEISTTNNMEV